jgi:pyruvate kinase
VIVATQMLESMVTEPQPTRAEASDVANAVLDGADALMLSAETSIGQHPVAAAATMGRIISTAEREAASRSGPTATAAAETDEVMARAAATVAEGLGARALVAFTASGRTARLLARHRPPLPLLAFTPDDAVRNQLALSWGVEAHVLRRVASTDEMVDEVERLYGVGAAARQAT